MNSATDWKPKPQPPPAGEAVAASQTKATKAATASEEGEDAELEEQGPDEFGEDEPEVDDSDGCFLVLTQDGKTPAGLTKKVSILTSIFKVEAASTTIEQDLPMAE